MPPSLPIEILLVEDNLADVELTREAFEDCRLPHKLVVARDGQQAIDLIRRRHAEEQLPDLILLDLNLPGKSGHEVLAELKSDPAFRRIPILILSGSRLTKDVLSAYDGHANSYIAKPVGLDRLSAMVRAVEDYWLNHAALPPRGSGNA